MQKTMQLAKQRNDKPHFVYAHLLLPHQPYFTDSLGNVLDIETQEKNKYQASPYLQYLQYANSKIQEMAKSIVQADSNSIIILISDHGYPDYPKAEQDLVFNNFLAIHVPDNKYNQLQNIKSNVHLFPVLLNTYFHQQIPLLKDSLFLIDEEHNLIQNSKN
jgi:membrane-anchored protein YejM (alkaline phosphatase superfamily)